MKEKPITLGPIENLQPINQLEAEAPLAHSIGPTKDSYNGHNQRQLANSQSIDNLHKAHSKIHNEDNNLRPTNDSNEPPIDQLLSNNSNKVNDLTKLENDYQEEDTSPLGDIFNSTEESDLANVDLSLQVPEREKVADIDFKEMAFPLRSEDRDDNHQIDYEDELGSRGGASDGNKACFNGTHCESSSPSSRWKNSKNANRNVELEYVANEDYWNYNNLHNRQRTPIPIKIEIDVRTRNHRTKISNDEKPSRRRLSQKRNQSSSSDGPSIEPVTNVGFEDRYVGERERTKLVEAQVVNINPTNPINDHNKPTKSRSRGLWLKLKSGVKKVARGAGRPFKNIYRPNKRTQA